MEFSLVIPLYNEENNIIHVVTDLYESVIAENLVDFEIVLVENAYKLINVIKVGNYAIRITWGDMHSDGIYTFEYLRKLDLSE